MDLPRSIVALGATWFLAQAHAECTSVEVLNPLRDSTIHDYRPGIKWAALSGVKLYRVQIESRVPEGQVIERIDTRVGRARPNGSRADTKKLDGCQCVAQ